MNEMRHDWLSDRWVIFAPNRTSRPDDYDRTPHIEPDSQSRCPFCRGSEHETPDPLLVLPGQDWESTRSTRQLDRSRPRADWLVRVVPNKYPALSQPPSACGGSMAENPADDRGRLFRKCETAGAHEVIVESPQHVSSITRLSDAHARLVFEAYRQRLSYWRARSDMKYAVVFKNYGADAGATIVHSHSQLICTGFVPSDVLRVHNRLATYLASHARCYVCAVLDQELESGERVVKQTDHFAAICPFASRFPYSVSIVPKLHRAHFEDCSDDEVAELASLVQTVLSAIESQHPRCSYNMVLQTSRFDEEHADAFHWRLKIIPRLSKIAGFEWGSDCFINTVLPEVAAQALRERIQCVAPIARPLTAAPIPGHTR